MSTINSRLCALLLVIVLAVGVVPVTTIAQDATPSRLEGSQSHSITWAAFEAELEATFGLEEPAHRGGQLIYGSISDIDTLNGMLVGDVFTATVTNLLFEPRVTTSPIDGQPAPALADSWEMAPDGMVFTFHLNPNARWHDGADVTADDAVFTVDALLDESPYGPYLKEILDSARAVDPDTVELRATKPLATFLYEIMFPIMPKHIWDSVPFEEWGADPGSTGQDPGRVVGTGPFRFAEWIPDDSVTLVRNDDYYGVVPALDEFIFRVLPDDTAALNALDAGEADLVDHIPGNAVAGLRSTDGLSIETFDSLFAAILAFNLDPSKTPLFQDREVRQALIYALDREAIVQSILDGFAEVAMGIQPPLSVAYDPDRITTRYTYDPEKASALLAQAGWTDSNGNGIVDKNGQDLRFEVIAPEQSPNFARMATYMQDAWRDVGVEAEVSFLSLQSLFELYESHEYDAILSGEYLPSNGSVDYLFACEAYETGANLTKYCNPDFDALVPREKAELDPVKRVDLLIEQANIVNDDLPIAFIAFFEEHAAYSDRLRNYHPTGYSTMWSLPWVWIED
jgi:peptide/nickel transport system substrate-binding protein